jgi:hypothetical protein
MLEFLVAYFMLGHFKFDWVSGLKGIRSRKGGLFVIEWSFNANVS